MKAGSSEILQWLSDIPRQRCCLALTSTDFQPPTLWKSISQTYAEEGNGSEHREMIQQEAGMEKLH